MKRQQLAVIVASVFCLGATAGRAQDNYAPPAYVRPPPANYYYFPEGAGPYIRGGVGPSFFEDGRLKKFGGPVNSSVQFDTGVAGDLAFGYAFNQYVSLDFETGYIEARINNVPGYTSDRSSLANVPLLANVTLSMPIPHSNVVPYAGLGAGGAVSVFDTDSFSDGVTTVVGRESDTVGAWQAFAGLRFMLGPRASLGVGYKYFATGNPTFSYPPSPNFDVGFRGARTHSLLLTFQASFW